MKTKCHQCGSEEAERFYQHERHRSVEICVGCGYVRVVSWYQIDINNELGKIIDILDDEKEIDDKTRLDSIRAVIEQ